jgi:AcrR family transcriptional regulator
VPPRRRAAARPVKRADRSARSRARPARRLGRDTYHHGDLRRALVGAAVAIIAEVGAEAFTLREAARRLGVNHRAAYRHFADKASLLAAVAEQGLTALVDGARAEIDAAGATDPEARLLAMARAYVEFADRHPAHFRVMFGPRADEHGPPRIDAPMSEAYQLLEAEIRAAVGAVPTLAGPGDDDVTDAVVAFWSVLHGLASLVLMRRVRVRRDHLPGWIDRVVGRVLRGLTTR